MLYFGHLGNGETFELPSEPLIRDEIVSFAEQ